MLHLCFKCDRRDTPKFHGILRRFGNGHSYGDMPYLYDQHNAGQLIINDKITLFNTRYNRQPGLVYSTYQ